MKAIKMSQAPCLPCKKKKGNSSDLKHALTERKNTFKNRELFDFSLYNATKL